MAVVMTHVIKVILLPSFIEGISNKALSKSDKG
jgi:hypothetical protein